LKTQNFRLGQKKFYPKKWDKNDPTMKNFQFGKFRTQKKFCNFFLIAATVAYNNAPK